MHLRAYAEAKPFVTADGSLIRELLRAEQQTLAEATLAPGQETQRHYHAASEELYYLLEGDGQIEVDGERRRAGPGDGILIPPGAWHQIRNDGTGDLRFLCCCAPPYSHDDTFFE
jgi:mannose-6-phosphate isomerase-like protein (cupin superfamily)